MSEEAQATAEEATEVTEEATTEASTEATTESNVEHLDSSGAKSELFGKDWSDITFEDLGLEKPLVGKFEKIGDLEKGYKEATAKLREKMPEAPEEYKINVSEDIELPEGVELTADDPILAAILPVAKEHGITQEALDGLVNAYIEQEMASATDPAAEKAKLGDKADAMIADAAKFVEKFPEAEAQLLTQLSATAEGINLINKLKDMSGEKQMPGETPPAIVDSGELWQAAQNYKKSTDNFDSNPAAQKEYDRLADMAIKAELAQKK